MRYSLRALLAFMLGAVLALDGLRYVWTQAEEQSRAVAKLRALSGAAYYDYQMDELWRPQRGAVPPGPGWLRSLVGVDALADVVSVEFWESRTSYAAGDFDALQTFTKLERLVFFDSPFPAEQIERLGALPHLRTLIIQQVDLSETDIAAIAALKQLEELNLIQSKYDPRWLKQLGAMPRLRTLVLGRSQLSGDLLAELQSNLSQCSIVVLDGG